MGAQQAYQQAFPVFAPPDAEARSPSRPIDLAHLSRQTMGDRALEQEVLGLFMKQAELVRSQLGPATLAERKTLAHALKGAARAIGAFTLADCLAEIEADPQSRSALRRLPKLIDDVRTFIAGAFR